MKKVAEPRKIPHLKMHDENEPLRPHLPPKKPVPPKPSSKPSVLPKKPVPKPPAKIILPKPQHKESDKHDLVKDKLNKTAPGMMEGLFKPIDSTNEGKSCIVNRCAILSLVECYCLRGELSLVLSFLKRIFRGIYFTYLGF